mmetsp:Transcript_14174/g.30259  ORF Transcript_14174/g.30259 Transcript_14174/m.30259 type:complete len:85 (+) Transcript_14174:552-806(+)
MEEGYDEIFRLRVALTNFHVSFHPLRDDEGANHYTRCKNRNYIIGERIANKRKAIQKKYRERRRRPWKLAMCPVPPISSKQSEV